MIELTAAAERIWLQAQDDCPALSVEVLAQADSTNSVLLARARAGLTAPTLLAAHQQTGGRGRQGRVWHARAGDSLTFSLGLALDLDRIPGGGQALSLAVGLTVAQALDAGLATWPDRPAPAAPIALKWPNDLWWDQRKLGGILIEVTPAPGLSPGQRWVVIGLGINVRPLEGADLPHASLSECAGAALSAGQVWHWLGAPLLRAVQRFESDGFAPLQAGYAQRDALAGREVALWQGPSAQALQGRPAQTGRAAGVDSQGALLVHTGAGLQRWTTGDVSVRLAAALQAGPPSSTLSAT